MLLDFRNRKVSPRSSSDRNCQKIQLEGEDDLNFLSFDMENASLDEVVAEAETLPFFGDQRLVFVEILIF